MKFSVSEVGGSRFQACAKKSGTISAKRSSRICRMQDFSVSERGSRFSGICKKRDGSCEG